MMGGVTFNPERHRIHELEIIRYLRKETGRKDLFLYRHEETGNWCVAVWLRPHHDFLELMLTQNPTDFDRDMVRTLREWANKKARTIKDWAREQEEQERDDLRKWDEDNKEGARVKRWLGNRQRSQVQRDHPDWNIPGFRTSIRMEAA